ncbi:RagB/SusD family nutrient uptake outer membrane protein [Flavobacterium sharifuzzamanii]|uniref:RagB/SusD family nutrient uptake outer membrane protein n=1 Tax=Flavobacterium sharifuzzamanii TaxID=2211133 RepID=UPI000DAD70D3|nr:RagB/SusD family nutrient uptake outer membrane protein [Flavobacterium sharifuzzamanii]KAF2079113.1 RagB/SusD family nutrient uptake outer membrane protein [Flavobacterium sharifuzzamanii]
MKKKSFLNRYSLLFVAVAFLTFGSCQDDFTDRPSEDGISLDSYYSTDDQVSSATNGMYSRTWFQMYNKFWWALEVGSGNMYSGSPDVSGLRTFSLNGSDPELVNGWSSLWANVQQSNMIINFLAARVGSGVSKDVLNNTIGEAYFMRATAYFDLVRLWGPVPIIENPLDYTSNPYVNTNPVEDIYKLITSDYLKAIDLLVAKNRGTNYANNGHVSKGSAKAMLAKAYLYQKDYAKARAMAEEVINSGEFKLLGGDQLPGKSFGDLFTYANNNNEESIFAIQWKGDGAYGSANNCNTQFGFQDGTLSTSNASYAGVFGPSQEVMLSLYGAGDLRKHETVMIGGDTYPNIKTTQGIGFTVPSGKDLAQASGGAIKKYCIGVVNGNVTGQADGWAMMDNNTYVMRYAELLLIHAEAVLAGGASTSDASALSSINAVRKRAGLAALTSITFDDIFLERRKELCFEGDYWFDLGRIDKAKAIAIMSAQNRGDRYGERHYTPVYSEDHATNDFYMDYPDNEVAKNPKLLQAPVPYTFK